MGDRYSVTARLASSRWLRWAACCIAAAVIIELVWLGWLRLYFGSIDAGLGYYAKGALVVPSEIDVGELDCKTTNSVSVDVRNLGETSARLLGAATGCTCMTVDGLPVEISGGKVVSIPIQIGCEQARRDDWFEFVVMLYTDRPNQRRLVTRLHGRWRDDARESEL